ncbi:hypothetical protein VB636_04260 [Paracoccus sp. APAP_BH8]
MTAAAARHFGMHPVLVLRGNEPSGFQGCRKPSRRPRPKAEPAQTPAKAGAWAMRRPAGRPRPPAHRSGPAEGEKPPHLIEITAETMHHEAASRRIFRGGKWRRERA